MASLVVCKNPLSPREKDLYQIPAGIPLIDWLQIHYPQGFGVPIRWFIGRKEQQIKDLDYRPKNNDVIIILQCPAGIEIALGALLQTLLVSVLTTAIVSAATYLLFPKPKPPGFADQEGRSTVYDIAAQQNAARLGEPVPVVYGSVLTTPDFCSQPYTYFGMKFEQSINGAVTNHRTSHDAADGVDNTPTYITNPLTPETFDNIHQVSTGWHETEYIDAAGSRKTKIQVYKNGVEYPESAATRGTETATETNIVDGVTITSRVYRYTSINLSGACSYPRSNMYLDLLLCVGQGEFEIDDVLIGNTSWKDLDGAAIQWTKIPPAVHQRRQGNLGFLFDGSFKENVVSSPEVGEQELIEPGDFAGWFNFGKKTFEGRAVELDIYFPAGMVDYNGNGVAWQTSTVILVQLRRIDDFGNVLENRTYTEKFDDFIKDPCRFTLRYSNLTGTGWQIRVIRDQPDFAPWDEGQNSVSAFILTAARLEIALDTNAETYGDVTLLAVRLQAVNGVAQNAQSRIRVRVKSIVEDFISEPGAFITSANPANAFADIYCNPVYGAARPVAELDTGKLGALRAYWASYEFNAVFTGKTTVFEALTNAINGVAAAPLPLGAFMSVNHNGTKSIRSMLFSPNNIVRDSFNIDYKFDPAGSRDGYEIEFRDPDNFSPEYARYPLDSVNPDKVTLFGCTSGAQAMEFAKLAWLQRLYQRKVLHFETELEGLIPSVGERIAVSHQMPRWGETGEIIAKTPDELTLTVDKNLDWTGGPFQVILRNANGAPSAPISVTQGAPNIIILAAGAGFPISTDETQERTYFAFGGVDDYTRDFLLTSITPGGGSTVTITAVNYDERPYQETLDFLDQDLDYDPGNPDDPIWLDENTIVDSDLWQD